MTEWQPIETAPESGEWFMTYSPDADDPFDFAVFDREQGHFCKVCCGYQYATHWMPMPPPPQPIGEHE